MLELWTIEPSPTPGDPRRHTLWLKGQLADVQAVIRRFGSLCGRPQKQRANADYNFSLHLHGPNPDVLRAVQSWLNELGPAGKARPETEAPAVVLPPPVALPPAFEPPRAAVPPAPTEPAPAPQALPELPAPVEAMGERSPAAPAASPFAGLMPLPTNGEVTAHPAAETPAAAASAEAKGEGPRATEGSPAADPFADLLPRPASGPAPSAEPPAPAAQEAPAAADALPPMPSFAQPQRIATPLPGLPPLGGPGDAAAGAPPMEASPFGAQSATPLPTQAPTPSPFGPESQAPSPFGPQAATPLPEQAATPSPFGPGPSAEAPAGLPAAPPPLQEAAGWPGSDQAANAAASPFASPGPQSPFGALPPAPTMFPGMEPPAPAGEPFRAPAGEPFRAPAGEPFRASSPTAPPGLAAAPTPEPPPAPAQIPVALPGADATPPPALAPVAAAGGGTNEPLFGAALAPQAAFTLETLQVGSFNRFSHAASMSVIANPGAMYNPLFLFGSPGVGKTHLLTAIGKELQLQSPNDPIFLTTGPRLSRAVALAKRAGRLGEIEAHAKKAKALLIDDVHTLAINEHNQEALAGLLAGFFSSTRQVVMTSVYPPRALGALEEALKFQISSGWSVDMKPLSLEIQKEIVGPALSRNGFDVDPPLIDSIIPKLEGSFFELTRWIDRLKALLELRAMNRQPSSMQDLLPILLMPDVPATTPMTTEEAQALAGDLPGSSTDPNALPTAVFFPQGREVHGDLIVRQFTYAMKQNTWPIPLRVVTTQAYDPEQLYGVPFALLDACAAAGARAALVLGPNPGSGLAAREAELQHAVQHLLEGLDLRVGWISFLRIKETGPYFRAGLDVYPLVRGGKPG